MKQEIGLRIKLIRENLHMTKEEFSKHLEITGQYLGTVERGKSCLSVEKLKRLCDYTNLSADYILFGKSSNSPQIDLTNLTPRQLELGYCALNELASFISSLRNN